MPEDKISPQSKSFIILFAFAAIGVAVAFYIIRWLDLPVARFIANGPGKGNYEVVKHGQNGLTAPKQKPVEPVLVDTDGWKTYQDQGSPLVFSYPPTWKVLGPNTKDGFTVITIDPGAKYDNIKIYISDKSFFALDGIPYQEDTIAGMPARNIQGMLFGIHANGTYYTFDEGASLSINPEFQTLVRSAKF